MLWGPIKGELAARYHAASGMVRRAPATCGKSTALAKYSPAMLRVAQATLARTQQSVPGSRISTASPSRSSPPLEAMRSPHSLRSRTRTSEQEPSLLRMSQSIIVDMRGRLRRSSPVWLMRGSCAAGHPGQGNTNPGDNTYLALRVCFQGMHIIVAEAEMMADFMNENVMYQLSKRDATRSHLRKYRHPEQPDARRHPAAFPGRLIR